MALLDSCCGCCPLRVGVIIITVINIIIYTLTILFFLPIDEVAEDKRMRSQQELLHFIQSVIYIAVIILIVLLIINIMLLYDAIKELRNPFLVYPWLIIQLLFCVTLLIGNIFTIVTSPSFSAFISNLISSLLTGLLNFYLLAVVFCYLKEEKT